MTARGHELRGRLYCCLLVRTASGIVFQLLAAVWKHPHKQDHKLQDWRLTNWIRLKYRLMVGAADAHDIPSDRVTRPLVELRPIPPFLGRGLELMVPHPIVEG